MIMKKVRYLFIFITIASLFFSLVGWSQSEAATPASSTQVSAAADFFKGKTIKIVIPFDGGNTSDIWARIMATYLAAKTGGNVIVSNQGAGGGLVARNEVYKMAKPDGLTILFDPTGAQLTPWLLNQEGVAYDPTKFEFLGGIRACMPGLMVGPKTNYKTVQDLQNSKEEIRFATAQVASINTIALLYAIDALKLNARVVSGYKSSTNVTLAIAQGEAHGGSSSLDAALVLERAGTAKVVVLLATERDKVYKDVPCLTEFIKPSDSGMKLLKGLPMDARVLCAPPGTPQDRVKFLKDNVAAVLADASFQRAITTMNTYWPGALTGEEVLSIATSSSQSKSILLEYYSTLKSKYVK
jgi:tripartite-type tricarboxylate transporter receptor subunit TctC